MKGFEWKLVLVGFFYHLSQFVVQFEKNHSLITSSLAQNNGKSKNWHIDMPKISLFYKLIIKRIDAICGLTKWSMHFDFGSSEYHTEWNKKTLLYRLPFSELVITEGLFAWSKCKPLYRFEISLNTQEIARNRYDFITDVLRSHKGDWNYFIIVSNCLNSFWSRTKSNEIRIFNKISIRRCPKWEIPNEV